MKKEFVEDIVNSVQEEYLKAREKRKPLELQWRLNMNFLMGNQYSEISLEAILRTTASSILAGKRGL